MTISNAIPTTQYKEAIPQLSGKHATALDINPPNPLHTIVNVLKEIITKDNMLSRMKKRLEELLIFVRQEESKETRAAVEKEEQLKLSNLHDFFRADLLQMYKAMEKCFTSIQMTTTATLTNVEGAFKTSKNVMNVVEAIATKVSKVTDTTVKIATITLSYRDVLWVEPMQPNKANTDPKVMGDMERKARQILIQVYNDEGLAFLTKSLSEIIAKANDAIDTIEDAAKPQDAKVESAHKIKKGAILLTLSNKEATKWITEVDIELTFTKVFMEGSHIRDRQYNLVVPRIPLTFEPGDLKQLHKLEETNNLRCQAISKAKWIKPAMRRQPDQTCYARTLGTFLLALWRSDCLLYGYGIVRIAGCHSWNPSSFSLTLCVPLMEGYLYDRLGSALILRI